MRASRLREAAPTFALALAVAVPGALAERVVAAWTGVAPRGALATDLGALLACAAFYAPFEQALALGAAWRAYATGAFRDRRGGALHAGAAALGVGLVLFGRELAAHRLAIGPLARVALALPAHVALALGWGAALGRSRERRGARGGALSGAWLAAAGFCALLDHLAFAPGWSAFVAAVPLAGTAVVVAMALRRTVGAPPSGPRRSRLPPLPAPSMTAMRDALRRARPVALGWIAFGALVTLGVLLVAVGAALALSRRAGVDFAAVDEGQVTSTAPLLWLGAAAMSSFPFAGWLVARASGAASVVEPALSAAAAITMVLVALGLAAPVALVFALASAPIAFLLACLGAWIGADAGG